ncbi:hypothetical protein [Aromatoleum bremense]|uniref:Uncharacterized protein n=1 Tax=Aromatoleum bremense TaxID=76115 RepID=A0ABX1NUU1_9RHOO|nr:hypothetical protein [Aromatoleum bremense]NMG15406.1 hypothetical protein [Aromatoleum bremense]QTQ34058.1 Uncharacterized protein pbN1_40750 [Aromatoleum bremense]
MASSVSRQLGLEAFLFAVEHAERGWELCVECALDGAWQAETILLGEALPAVTEDAPILRIRLVALLQERLAGCSKRR